MNLAGTLLLVNFPVYGQYICTVLLIAICVTLVAHITVTICRKKGPEQKEQPYGEDTDTPYTKQSAGVSAAGDELAATDAHGTALPFLLPSPFFGPRVPRIVYGSYDRSFLARLLLADDSIKSYYVGLANELLGYKNVRCRISWAYATFACGRRILAKIAIKGKTLCIHLPLDPAEYVNTKYGAIDVSEVKKYAAVPTRLKVRSPRGMKYARELIARVAGDMSLVQGDKGSLSVSDFPFEPFESLLARRLIKLRTEGGVPLESGDTLAWTGIERRERISASEVRNIALPEEAMLPKAVSASGRTRTFQSGKKCIVNIDTLSAHFSAGDIVDISALKQRGLIPQKGIAVKVLARGILNKPLTVIADDFSADAVKMIVLTGGKVFLS